MNRIEERFARLKRENRKGFIVYTGAGDPDLEATRPGEESSLNRMIALIEGVVEGLIGAGLAVGVLFAFKALFINPLYGNIRILPWVQTGDVIATIPWLVASGVVVALLASFAGMRRFLDI